MKAFLVLSFITFGNVLTVWSQDPHFSQKRNTPLLINPANTSLQHDLRVLVNYRNQWSSFVSPFQTSTFSIDAKTAKDQFRKSYIGVGLQFMNDKAGSSPMSLTQGSMFLSGIVQLDGNNKLSLGLMGGFGQRSMNYHKLRWESQYDGAYNASLNSNENLSQNNFNYFDAGTGIAWSYGKQQSYITANDGIKANVGISAYHFGLPKASFYGQSYKLYTKYIVHGSMEFGKTNTNLTFIPEVYFSQQAKQRELLIGNTIRYLFTEGSHVTGFIQSFAGSIGVYYRWKDALISTISLDYGNYSIGFSYDFTISALAATSNSRGGFELYLKFVTPNPFKNTSSAKFR